MIEELLEAAYNVINDCECEAGCPSCVHSPKCGSGNKPLDKRGALNSHKLLLGKKNLEIIDSMADITENNRLMINFPEEVEENNRNLDYRILFFDLETQRSADDVGGWRNKRLMRIAVATVYDSIDQKFTSFLEGETDQLMEKLKAADLIVGFNLLNFDYAVLQPYTTDDLVNLKTFDILDDIKNRLGFRLSLNHLAEKTLGEKKSADGLQSLQWFRDGKIDLVTEYCVKDVEITKNLFQFGISNRYLLYERRGGGIVRIPLDWELDNLVNN